MGEKIAPGCEIQPGPRTRGGDETRKDRALPASSFIDGDNRVRKMKDGFQHPANKTMDYGCNYSLLKRTDFNYGNVM